MGRKAISRFYPDSKKAVIVSAMLFFYPINKSVFPVHSPAPESCQIRQYWFRFSGSEQVSLFPKTGNIMNKIAAAVLVVIASCILNFGGFFRED